MRQLPWILFAVLVAACARPKREATLRIDGVLSECPPRPGFAVQPLQQEVGNPIQLVGQSADGGVGSATFAWSESQGLGELADPGDANTTFVCGAVGITTISLVVTEASGCVHLSSADVACVAPQLCGNQALDPGEVCDGRLGVLGPLPASLSCAPDCRSYVDRCASCERTYCRYEPDTREDLIALCQGNPDADLARRCGAVVDCARKHRCGFGLRGLSECYCGGADDTACLRSSRAEGPCRAELEAAVGSTDAARVLAELTNLDLPARRASLLLRCDRAFCATVCVPQ